MSQIPHLLSPYLALPSESSLILLTSVLGASTNWLLLRYLQSFLRHRSADVAGNGGAEKEDVKVLLVSFMRDWAFWKEGGRRLGLDFDKLTAEKRVTFLDGLSRLFAVPTTRPRPSVADANILQSSDVPSIHATIKKAIKSLQDGGGKVVLVIDQLDLLVATSADEAITVALGDMLMDLRQDVHATIMTLAADKPLVTAQQTPLEINYASLLLGLTHQADLVMGLRLLDTGTARDVSGVCRISVGDTEDGEPGEAKLEARELLYFVGGDGGVKVFERGQ